MAHSFARVISALCLATSVPAAPPVWGQYGFDSAKSGQTFNLGPKRGVQRWSYHAAKNQVSSSPAIAANGVVVVGSTNSDLIALNGTTGALLWRVAMSDQTDSSPAIVLNGAAAVVGDNAGTVLCVNITTGAKIWQASVGASIYLSSFVDDGVSSLYIGSRLGVYSFTTATGALRWQNTALGTIYGSPAISLNNVVYVSSSTLSMLYGLDPATGKVLTSWPVTGVVPSPIVSGDYIIAGCSTGLKGFNEGDATLNWSLNVDSGLLATPSVTSDGRIFAVGSKGTFVAATSTGTLLFSGKFTAPSQGYYCQSKPAIDGKSVVYVGCYNTLFAISMANGRTLWNASLPSLDYSSPAIGADASLVIGSGNGIVYSLI